MLAPKPSQSKSETAAQAPAPPAGEPEILLTGTNDDDFNPYTVRGDIPTATCPECGKAIHEGVPKCKHCGVDFDAKRKAERVFAPVDQVWENGWPLQTRIKVFAILQVINLAVLLAPLMLEQSGGLFVSGAIVSAGLQAFLLGTFDRLHLTRNAKGKVVLTQMWRFAFIAGKPQTIRWKEHEGIRIAESDEIDLIDWLIGAILFFYGVIPGIFFWWYVLRPDKLDVMLCKDHGCPATLLCRTTNEQRAREIMTTISEVAMLPVLK